MRFFFFLNLEPQQLNDENYKYLFRFTLEIPESGMKHELRLKE